MDISIEPGRVDHLDGIHALVLEWGYTASRLRTKAWLEAIANSPDHQLFVALSGGSVVGWIAVEKRLFLSELFVAEITGLVVGSRARRAGIGQLLVQSAEDWSSSMGLPRVVVRSNVTRLESHGFYPAVGYTQSKTTHVYTKDLKQPGSEP